MKRILGLAGLLVGLGYYGCSNLEYVPKDKDELYNLLIKDKDKFEKYSIKKDDVGLDISLMFKFRTISPTNYLKKYSQKFNLLYRDYTENTSNNLIFSEYYTIPHDKYKIFVINKEYIKTNSGIVGCISKKNEIYIFKDHLNEFYDQLVKEDIQFKEENIMNEKYANKMGFFIQISELKKITKNDFISNEIINAIKHETCHIISGFNRSDVFPLINTLKNGYYQRFELGKIIVRYYNDDGFCRDIIYKFEKYLAKNSKLYQQIDRNKNVVVQLYKLNDDEIKEIANKY